MKKILYSLAALAIIILGIFIATHKTSAPTTEAPGQTTQTQAPEKIRNLSLLIEEKVSGTVTITGEAAGLYFEGSFPITLTDSNNKIVTTLIAQAQGDWMTTNFVPFTTQLNTTEFQNGTYTLTFKQDDQSDGESGKEIYTFSLPIIIDNNL